MRRKRLYYAISHDDKYFNFLEIFLSSFHDIFFSSYLDVAISLNFKGHDYSPVVYICAFTSTRKSTGHQLESLSIFKSLNTSSLKSAKSFYALRQSFLGYPEGRCVILSFEFLFKNSVEFLKVDDWLYSGRSGRGLGLATKAASPSCTGISAGPKMSLSAFPLLMHFKKRQQSYIPSNAFERSKADAHL